MKKEFDLENAVAKWLKSFRRHRAFGHGTIREMESHLLDQIDDLVARGNTKEEAFHVAVKSFGEISDMAEEEFSIQQRKQSFNSIINRSMLNTYIKVAARNFWKYKFYSSLNIIGLTVGLAIVFFIGLFVSDELSFDQFHTKKNELFRVVEFQHYAGQPEFPVAVTPTALGPSLESDYPEIVTSTRISRENNSFQMGDRSIVEDGIMVDAAFFEMFSFDLKSGNVDAFKGDLKAIVLTEKLAEKYFVKEDPIGKVITIDNEDHVVHAVAFDPPSNSHLDFNYILNFEDYLAGDSSRATNFGSNWLYTYIEVEPMTNVPELNEKVKYHFKKFNEESTTDLSLQSMNDVYLGTVDFVVEVNRKGELMYVRIFTLVAVFILIISCINFMNLSTARSEKRAKEVGMRKAIGARRSQLIFQFLSESVLLSVLAVVIAVGIVAFLLPAFNQITGKNFLIQTFISDGNAVPMIIGVLTAAILTGVAAGIYPALFLSSVQPVTSLKSQGTLKGGGALRRVLVVLQFSISLMLIIGTLVVYEQFKFIQDVDLGYNRQNIAYAFAPRDKASVFAEEIRKISGISDVGLSNRHPAYVLSSSSGYSWPGTNPDEEILMHYMGTDEHYLPTMEMRITEGRNFVHSDSLVLIINERAKEMMGLEDPVGQLVSTQTLEIPIVGVVSNFNFKSIHTQIEPLFIFKVNQPNRLYIRYEPGTESSLKSNIEATWKTFFPDREFELYFLDTDFNEMYDAEQRTSKLSTYFAGIAILISCLGLFGLVSYATEQRTKEIGIRKVLGASVPKLFLLLVTDFSKMIAVSLVISIPLGWYAMQQWLNNYAYRIELTAGIFVLAGLAVVVIAFLTVSYQSIKVSITNPVKSLRSE